MKTLWDLNMITPSEPPGDTALYWDEDDSSLVLRLGGAEMTVEPGFLIDQLLGNRVKLKGFGLPPRPAGCGDPDCEITPGQNSPALGCSCLDDIRDRAKRARLRAMAHTIRLIYSGKDSE